MPKISVVVMILSLFLITGCFNDKTEITNERENVVTPIETEQENIKVENLGMTFAEFKNNCAIKRNFCQFFSVMG